MPEGFEFSSGEEEGEKGEPRDGAWVVIQDWTGCTLLCGGGRSY